MSSPTTAPPQISRFRRAGLLGLIMLLGAYPPLTTDIYLPAVTAIGKQFQVDSTLVNLTLVFFFIFFSLGMLIWGPLSDRWGRKPVLYITNVLYTGAAILCGLSWNIYALIVFRVFQAIGAAGAVTISLAMIKDTYQYEKREKVLAIIGTIMAIAPIVAPVLGAILLKFISWRGIFFALAGLGVFSFLGSLFVHETSTDRTDGNLFVALGRLLVVLKNPSFTIMVCLFSLMMVPVLSFVGASPYIYMQEFGLSEQTFSMFFAANAFVMGLGPMLFILLSKFFYRRSIITCCFLSIITGGVLVLTFGSMSPWIFALTVLPTGLGITTSRPPSMNLCLEQQDKDTGSASSLINCTFALAGSLGMMIVSFDWQHRIMVLGTVYLCVGIISLLMWPIALRHRRRESS